MATNSIGLNKKQADKTALKLNELLANYHILYQNLRGYHWNVRGEKFFELHLKFEELYTDINLKIDDLAERILALDTTPVHTFSEYIKTSSIKEARNVSDGKKILKALVGDFKTILVMQREVLKSAEESGDEGTITLLTDYITQQEKTVWMLNAVLG